MKKVWLLIAAGIICVGTMAFAEDAKVLPARVGRLTIAPAFAFANDVYDTDGKSQSLSGSGALKAFNLGFALEYGIIDWITAAVQWAPGWNIWSDVELENPFTGKDLDATINGVYDIFLGAKLQIVGENAPVKSSMFRAAVAPGVIIPLPGVDVGEELIAGLQGKTFVAANIDRHVFGFGARGYFDYLISELFYINLYTEYIAFPIENSDTKETYGWQLTFELEPHFDINIVNGITLGAGIPVNFRMTPDTKFDGVKQDDDSYILAIKPNISCFITTLPLPLELELGYSLPLAGKNERATNSLSLLVKLYLKI
ncbi:MAG: hypothetical protein LBR47_01345 [Spirochaetaceae bacterium]|nr:hypothetical protein [Spirochaetaceae bacterium]